MFPTAYHLLKPPIPKELIIDKLLDLNLVDSPVLRLSRGEKQVRQAYFIPISNAALSIVVRAAANRSWPKWARIGRKTESQKAKREIARGGDLSAIEGLAQETSVLVRNRNGALRKRALDEAKGVC